MTGPKKSPTTIGMNKKANSVFRSSSTAPAEGKNGICRERSSDDLKESMRRENHDFHKKTINSNRSESLRHNLRTNVQVCARIRPLQRRTNSKEREPPVKSPFQKKKSNRSKLRKQRSLDDGNFIAWDLSENNKSALQSNKIKRVQGRTNSYTLDKVFGVDATTKTIYQDSVASLVEAAMEGYNSTILAYGQTSTGKTHTMTGTQDDPGLVPLCITDCFNYVRENPSDESREYLFRFSYLEIYKENIRDLLSSTNSAPEPVRLFDGPNGLIVHGVKEEVVSSPEKIFQLLKQGDRRRQVGATHMNQHSSRSHVVARLKIESSFAARSSDETRVSILSLVDLAGSESVRLNGAERREEGQYINKSLMALGQVVLGLSEASKNNGEHNTNRSHIPYRDSKLTRLLQSSLSGNAQMLLMCCISPLASHLEESHNTFKFAIRAKRIKQKASVQTTKENEETLLQTYRNEIEYLKQQLAEATEQKEQLIEQQREFEKIEQRQESVPENIEVVATAIKLPSIDNSEPESNTMEIADGEIEELVEAIQTMEQLILKSQPLQNQQTLYHNKSQFLGTVSKSESSSEIASNGEESEEIYDTILKPDDLENEDNTDASTISNKGKDSSVADSKFANFAQVTPQNRHRTTASSSIQGASIDEKHLHSELTRVRGILATVLQKRGVVSITGNGSNEIGSVGFENVRKTLDFSTPTGNPNPLQHTVHESLSEELKAGTNVDEVRSESIKEAEERKIELESLRMQLYRQERKTNLHKADSHYLQLQLEEKDKLLEDVSSLLEAVEKRQGELERENFALKREINTLREERGEERGIIIRNTPF